MEESKALSKLSEVTDLLTLLEDLLNPAAVSKLSPSSWSGLRITLRNAKATLNESQSTLTKEFANRAKAVSPLSAPNLERIDLTEKDTFTPSTISAVNNASSLSGLKEHAQAAAVPSFERSGNEPSRVQITRRDLKATLEKFIESR